VFPQFFAEINGKRKHIWKAQ